MRTNNMKVGAIAFMLVLGGCAQPGDHVMGNPPQQAPKIDPEIHTRSDCGPGACVIQLVIGNGCRVTARPFNFGIPSGMTNVTITWKLPDNADGWVFDDVGIDFKNAPDFVSPDRKDDHTFEVQDKNGPQNNKTPYRYTIQLKNPSGKCTYDPIIINGA